MNPEGRKRIDAHRERVASVDLVAFNESYALFHETVGAAAIPLLSSKGGKHPEAIASGVLVRVQGKVVIFTAAHAMHQLKDCIILIPGADGRLREIEANGHGSNRLDVGILEILNSDLEPFRARAVPAGAIFMQSQTAVERMTIFGHPARNFKTEGDSVMQVPELYRLRSRPEGDYLRLGYDPHSHLLLNRLKKVISARGLTRSLSLAGMSGCGVWYVSQQTGRTLSVHAPGPLPRLVGIFIEERRRDNVLVAVNVNVLVQLFYEAFSALRAEFDAVCRQRIGQQLLLEKELGLSDLPEEQRQRIESFLREASVHIEPLA